MNLHRCECEQDGFCQRYKREMRGRFREICRGINVDLGTAAAFRVQWASEAQSPRGIVPKRLTLKTEQAPGDALAMTAAIYSLHRANPGAFLTSIDTPYKEVFQYNPDVVGESGELCQLHYPAIHQSNTRAIHFMQGCCEFLGTALGVPCPLLTNRPRLYFDTPEPETEDFWLLCAGVKSDFTNKQWGGYQQVVDTLKGTVRFVQVGAGCDKHPLLSGVDDRVGWTTLRQLFELARRCRGVLCGVSLLMHVAAALEKPAVVVAGGREPVPWNAYPKQHYMHTIGMLPCCESGGCWKSRTVPRDAEDKDVCVDAVDGLPHCMRLVMPGEVAQKIWTMDLKAL